MSARERRRWIDMQRILGSALAAAALLAGCAATPPVHLYTLLPSAPAAPRAAAGPSVLLDSVAVPPAVDPPQWLVRMPDGALVRLENERWAASLSDELRAALLDALVSRHGIVDARSPGAPAAQWRVRLEVTRFETASDGDTRLEGVWALSPVARASGGAAETAMRCPFALRDNAGLGAPALAEAHRREVARLGDAIGTTVLARARGEPAACAA
jgi:uncharacterized lipoprotein YmbA